MPGSRRFLDRRHNPDEREPEVLFVRSIIPQRILRKWTPEWGLGPARMEPRGQRHLVLVEGCKDDGEGDKRKAQRKEVSS